MSITDKYKYIIVTLIKRTSEGKAIWNSTGVSNKYIIQFKNYALITYSDSIDSFCLDLMNNDGEYIDKFRILRGEVDYKSAIELYYLARRAALKVDKLIEGLLEEISSW